MKYNPILKSVLFPILFGVLVSLVAGSYGIAVAGSFKVGGILVHKKVKSLKDLKFTNIVRQTRDYSCGAASIATILTYYIGRETSEEEVLNTILSTADGLKAERIKEKGLSLLDLKKFAQSLGYVVKGYRVPDYHNIAKLKVPAIAIIDYRGLSHFVVVKGSIGGDVFIADPARGNLEISLEEFGRIWGNVLLVCMKPNGEPITSNALSVNHMTNKKFMWSSQIHTDMIRSIISTPLDFN